MLESDEKKKSFLVVHIYLLVLESEHMEKPPIIFCQNDISMKFRLFYLDLHHHHATTSSATILLFFARSILKQMRSTAK